METSLDKLIHTLSTQIINLPYILVEYKPAFGHIFAEYLKDYSHWGYSDLDVVFGDMSRWIDDDEWNDYDIVTYGFGELDTLVPAYAATIHKSQGSEYPAVVIPILTQHYAMLQRNLLYTGVTRGKRLVVLVGQKKAVAIAVKNVSGRRRWSRSSWSPATCCTCRPAGITRCGP